MATLRAMFKLTDAYSRTIDNVMQKTDKASDKILKASGQTDKFNRQLDATGVSAGRASGGLGKLIGSIVTITGLIKGMSISDEFTNTSARLNLINDGMQTQLELQDKIFASAKRSRGVYSEMASAISKMGLLAGDAFTSNDELIAFTELVQKSFKVGGADTSEQQGAMRQLSQAMASGRLQGDELVSIMENAPMIYNAIAKYTGKSKGELKELGSEGKISADIIKNAMFMAGDDINKMFAQMPRNFGDVWNDIKNGATKAFRPFIDRVNKAINTEQFQKFVDTVVDGFYMIANLGGKALDGIERLYNYINDNSDDIADLVYAGASAWLAYKGALLLVQGAQWLVNVAMGANPIGATIVLLAGLVAVTVLLWEKSEGYRDFVGEAWSYMIKASGHLYNAYAKTFNFMAVGWNNNIIMIGNLVDATRIGMKALVTLTGAGVKGMINMFSPLIDYLGMVIDGYNAVAGVTGKKTIDFKLNSKSLTSAIDEASNFAKRQIDGAYGGVNGLLEKLIVDKPMDILDVDKLGVFSDFVGDKISGFSISGWLEDTFEKLKGVIPEEDAYDPYSDTMIVKGLGANGAVKVDMSDEDLKYLRDIAERDYINKFSTATLAPNIQVTFGDVHETADADKVAGRIKQILQEEIAMTAEGAYS